MSAPGDDQVAWRWLWAVVRDRWPLLALAVAIIVVAILTTVLPDSGLPLDPDSTGPDGTRALVEVLDALDHPVDIVGPDGIGDADVVLVLDDKLSDTARDALRRRVRDGARVVIADPESELAPPDLVAVDVLDRALERGCDVPAIAAAQTVRPADTAFEIPDGATGCFDTADGSWLVIEPVGQGHIVSLGDAGILTNSELGDADHTTLITQLLTPADGGSITVVRPTLRPPGEDAIGLSDLIPTGVKVMLLQLLIAFGVLVLWRARRLGPPLVEYTPVRLANAEQTIAVGALLARNTTRAAAVARIARDTRRRLARRLGLHRGAETDEIAAAVAARTGQDGAAIAAVLEPAPPGDDAGLLRATADLTTVERNVADALSADIERGADV